MTCPSCGYCPACGRKNAAPHSPWNVPYVQPYVRPWTSPYWDYGTIRFGDPLPATTGGTTFQQITTDLKFTV